MKKRNRCLVIVLVIALLLATADVGVSPKKADAATETETVAYLEFSGKWGESYKGEADSVITADNALVDGDGVYSLSLDFAQANDNCAHGIASCIVRIKDGENLYGSTSYIQVRSVKIINAEGEEKSLTNIPSGYTYAESGNTSLCLSSAWNRPNAENVRSISGKQITGYNDWEESDYQLIDDLVDENIRSIEVVFAFATNADALAQIPTDATPRPHTTTTPDATETPDPWELPTATPEATETPNPWDNPTATPEATETSNPWADWTASPSATPNPDNPTATPKITATPNPDNPTATPQNTTTPNPSGDIKSNSTYTGQEKIFVNKSAVVVAAGGHASVTIALLRGASSTTQVTVSSGNSSIAVPTIQSNGKLDIAVPAAASAGSSTTITLRFGSSSAAVKVTVSNPVTQIKGAKKAYTIKRKKTAKVSVNLTPKNTANTMTDTVTASISKKKVASVTSVKLSKNKAVIKVKALKKGSAKLKVKAGGKSASIKIKVK